MTLDQLLPSSSPDPSPASLRLQASCPKGQKSIFDSPDAQFYKRQKNRKLDRVQFFYRLWTASTFSLKRGQLGSAHSAARTVFPQPDATQLGLWAAGLVMSLTWTISSGHIKHAMCGHASLPLCKLSCLQHLHPCSPGENSSKPLGLCINITSSL